MSKSITIIVIQIVIDRGIATKVSKEIWPWELPVYEAKFGEGACVETGTRECETVLPDAGEEFARMHTAFGVEEDTKQNFVDLAFGRGKAGINALESAMKNSTVKKVTAAKRAAAKKAATKKAAAKKAAAEKAEAEAMSSESEGESADNGSAGNGDPLA